MNQPVVNEVQEQPADLWGGRSCTLEELADRIGAVIARVTAGLRRETGEQDAEAVVRAWIAGLQPGARARFLAVALSDRYLAEGPAILGAIRDSPAWPGPRSPVALDPSGYSCEPVADAAGHDVMGRAGAGRVQSHAGHGDPLRE